MKILVFWLKDRGAGGGGGEEGFKTLLFLEGAFLWFYDTIIFVCEIPNNTTTCCVFFVFAVKHHFGSNHAVSFYYYCSL